MGKLKLKVMSGNKEDIEKQYNEFAEKNVIRFQNSLVTHSGEGSGLTYHLFVYYN